VRGGLRSPIIWFGGKGILARRIVPLLPSHRFYVEPFGGGASILLAKEPAEVETYNDIDQGLYDFFSVMADPSQFRELYRRVKYLPYSRQLYNECRSTWAEQTDRIERVWRWFVVARQSFSGRFGTCWSSAITHSRRNQAETCSGWHSAIRQLRLVHARLVRVQIECADFRTILKRYDGPDYLAYCDPPYLHQTREDKRYRHEMTDDDHAEMLELLLNYEGKVVLSGYPNDMYAEKLLRWSRIDIPTACHAAGRTRATGIQGKGAALKMQPRTECLWLNPAAAAAGTLFEEIQEK